MANAKSVKTHYHFITPFGLEYEYDIAILGPRFNKEALVLGVIELEKTHRFGYLKTLISKCLGFPLISIDISNLAVSDINSKWCEEAVTETTATSEDSLRRNYIYLHNFLYPIYLDVPENVRGDTKHQFVIFSSDNSLEKLSKWIRNYAERLSLNSPNDFILQPVNINRKVVSSKSSFINEGSIAGNNWEEINDSSFIRLTIKVPRIKEGHLYLFHLVLARLINSHFNCLVGYKYAKGIYNNNPDNNSWIESKTQNLIAPKSLTEPTLTIIQDLINDGLFQESDFLKSDIP